DRGGGRSGLVHGDRGAGGEGGGREGVSGRVQDGVVGVEIGRASCREGGEGVDVDRARGDRTGHVRDRSARHAGGGEREVAGHDWGDGDGVRDRVVDGVETCGLPVCDRGGGRSGLVHGDRGAGGEGGGREGVPGRVQDGVVGV